MDTEPRHEDELPERTHEHGWRPDIKDMWCYNCETVTDFCKELNDFGQDVPNPPS